jgi:hypothetical protein
MKHPNKLKVKGKHYAYLNKHQHSRKWERERETEREGGREGQKGLNTQFFL